MSVTSSAIPAPSKLSDIAHAASQVSIFRVETFISTGFSYLIILYRRLWIKPNICINISHCDAQDSSEEQAQQLKERLSRLFKANEQRCSRSVLYGADLLQVCTLSSEPPHSALTAGGWRWIGRESCLRAQRTCMATTSTLQSTLLSAEHRLVAAHNLIKRYFKPERFTIMINQC